MDEMMSDELHANGSLVKDGHTEARKDGGGGMRRIDIFGSSTIWSGLRHSGPSGAERDGASERGLCLKGCKIGGGAVAKR